MQPEPSSRWRRRAVLGVAAVWGLVSLARSSRLFEPAESPPGREVEPMLAFLRATIPPDAGVLYVLPGSFGGGADTGAAPRLRYELFPRAYDDVRASEDETSVQRLMRSRNLGYVVVADAQQYATDSWLRAPRAWLRRIEFTPSQYVLMVVA